MFKQKQNTILRLTINLDYNYPDEVAFVKAMLKRLNVLYAKARPRSALSELLGDSKLRETLQAGRDRKNKQTSPTVPTIQPVVNLPATQPAKAPVTHQTIVTTARPSKNTEDEVREFRRNRHQYRIVVLKELQFDPPDWVANNGVAEPAAGSPS
jgi:hypothetical protein